LHLHPPGAVETLNRAMGFSTLWRLPCFFNDHLQLHSEDYLMLANDSFMHSFRKHTDVLADGEEHPRRTPHHKEHVADHRQDPQLYASPSSFCRHSVSCGVAD
jgi:hypothetical protein